MTINALTPDKYHQDTDYISNSSLSNFVSFDAWGNPTYNIHAFLNPTPPSNDAIIIGSIVDQVLTEGFVIDDEYGPQLDKAGMQNELDMLGIEYKKADTNPVLRELLINAGYIFKKELKTANREAIDTIIDRAHNFQYDAKTTLSEFIAECDKQMVITNDSIGMRGKFDLINHKRKIISDLKTTGNLERFMKELIYQGKPNIYHRYIRQLAIYQELYFLETGERYETELIIIDHKGNHNILRIGQTALDRAYEQVKRDIEVLRQMYTGEIPYVKVYDIGVDEVVMNVQAEEQEDFLSDND